jgi:hypothetical protein
VIGEKYVRLAVTPDAPLNIYTRDSLAPRQDEQASGGNNVLQIGHAFGRSNLTGGEGLDWWPRIVGETGSELDRIRFWDSANLDISRPEAGQPYQVKLTKAMETFWTPTDAPVDMGASRDAIYIAAGNDVHRFDDWTDNTPDDTDTLGAVDIAMIDVGLDDTVVVVNTDGDIYIKPSVSDAYVLLYEAGVTGNGIEAAWWRKGRVMAVRRDAAAADDAELIEISPGIGGTPAVPTAAGVVVVIDTFAGECNDIADAGHALVAAFSDGSIRSYVPQTDSAGGTPVLTVRARVQVPTGENPTVLGWNIGNLMVLTVSENPSSSDSTVRLYQGEVLDVRFEFVVGPLQLARVWSTSTETAPNYTKNMVSTRDEMFFTVCEGPSVGFSLWRFDLVTNGLFRQHQTACASGGGLVYFDGRIAFIDGPDITLESETDYVAEGYVITPNITFGLNTPINWTNFVLEAQGLESAGARVELYRSIDPASILSPDAPGWVLVETFTDPIQSGVELAKINITSNHLAMMVKVYPSNGLDSTPNVTNFAVRGLAKHRDWIVDLPVNVSDYVTAPNRSPMRVPGHGDAEHRDLVALQGLSTTLEVYDPPITLKGIVETILEPTGYITDRGSQSKMCMIRFLGSLVGTEESASSQGNAGLGVATLGIGTLGIGEI